VAASRNRGRNTSLAWAVLAILAGCGDGEPLAPLPEDRRWLDLPYATESAAQSLDLYLPPSGDGPFPLLVWIHGGGWRGATSNSARTPSNWGP